MNNDMTTKVVDKKPKQKSMLKKLGSDDATTGYEKPYITMAEMLTDDQIKKMLEDYKRVKPIELVKGDHVRYFTVTDGKSTSFKLGGSVLKTDGLPTFIVLTNGKLTWSVQCKNNILFKKISQTETINDLKTELIFKNDKIEDINVELQDIQHKYNDLQKEMLKRDKQIKKLEMMVKKLHK
jgi:hypothetical protein